MGGSRELQLQEVSAQSWKSAPYFPTSCDGYKLRDRIRGQHGSPTVLHALHRSQHVRGDQLRAFQRIDPGNARLRALEADTVGDGWWKLLWVPPTLPYTPRGPYKNASMTKRLVFSSWSATPTAVASLLSHEAERLLAQSAGVTENSPEQRKGTTRAMAVSMREGEPADMPTLAAMWPAPALAELGDPLRFTRTTGATQANPTALKRHVLQQLAERMGQADEPGGPTWDPLGSDELAKEGMVLDTNTKSGVVRAMGVLDYVRDRAPHAMGVTEIAKGLGIAKAVAHRILKDFTSAGYLAFSDSTKTYSLGSAAVLLGVTAFQTMDTVSLARPHLDVLVDQTGETATLSVKQGWTRVYIAQAESPQEIRMAVQLGSRHPLHSGASSKAILAALPDAEVTSYIQLVASESRENPEVVSGRLWPDLLATRQRGHSLSLGERESGAVSVACPIYAPSGEVWGAVSVAGPNTRYDQATWSQHARSLQAAATEISFGLKPYSDLLAS